MVANVWVVCPELARYRLPPARSGTVGQPTDTSSSGPIFMFLWRIWEGGCGNSYRIWRALWSRSDRKAAWSMLRGKSKLMPVNEKTRRKAGSSKVLWVRALCTR